MIKIPEAEYISLKPEKRKTCKSYIEKYINKLFDRDYH